MGNIHGRRLNMDILKPKGSGYVASHGADFLMANDAWARFINFRYGPDGNVYLIDWYDKQACHTGAIDAFDRTNGRKDTFFDGPVTAHVSSADPYCPVLRGLLVGGCNELGIDVHDGGTVVVVQGPRFSTRAESRWYSQMGWEAINMTAYPECFLAREEIGRASCRERV